MFTSENHMIFPNEFLFDTHFELAHKHSSQCLGYFRPNGMITINWDADFIPAHTISYEKIFVMNGSYTRNEIAKNIK